MTSPQPGAAAELHCPRCAADVRPTDRYCWNCGKRLPARRYPGEAESGRNSLFVALLVVGPTLGALVALAIAETVTAAWPTDVAEVAVVLVFVGIGAALGGPILMWILERLGFGDNGERPRPGR